MNSTGLIQFCVIRANKITIEVEKSRGKITIKMERSRGKERRKLLGKNVHNTICLKKEERKTKKKMGGRHGKNETIVKENKAQDQVFWRRRICIGDPRRRMRSSGRAKTHKIVSTLLIFYQTKRNLYYTRR